MKTRFVNVRHFENVSRETILLIKMRIVSLMAISVEDR